MILPRVGGAPGPAVGTGPILERLPTSWPVRLPKWGATARAKPVAATRVCARWCGSASYPTGCSGSSGGRSCAPTTRGRITAPLSPHSIVLGRHGLLLRLSSPPGTVVDDAGEPDVTAHFARASLTTSSCSGRTSGKPAQGEGLEHVQPRLEGGYCLTRAVRHPLRPQPPANGRQTGSHDEARNGRRREATGRQLVV